MMKIIRKHINKNYFIWKNFLNNTKFTLFFYVSAIYKTYIPLFLNVFIISEIHLFFVLHQGKRYLKGFLTYCAIRPRQRVSFP